MAHGDLFENVLCDVQNVEMPLQPNRKLPMELKELYIESDERHAEGLINLEPL
jgi:hypothetical protein